MDSILDTIYDDAFVYDQIHAPLATGKDLEFYAQLATGKKVLEIACGSGRYTIPLALRGVEMTGLDISSQMLEEAKAKATQNKAVVRWIHDDCTKFSISDKFDLIVMPGNSLQHLQSTSLVCIFLKHMKQYLKPGGIFAFDIWNPNLSILSRDPNTTFFVTKFKNKTGEEVTLEESTNYDGVTQVSSIKWFHKLSNGKLLKTDFLELRQFFPQEIRFIVETCGWEILHQYGSWNLMPLKAQDPRQICVLRVRS